MTTTKTKETGSRSVAMLRRHLHPYLVVLLVLVSCCLDRIDSWTPDVLTKSYITYGKWVLCIYPFQCIHAGDLTSFYNPMRTPIGCV